MITAFYAGILGLWLAYLYLTVVKFRREYHVGLGDGDREDLHKVIRIHGNFTETVPYILLLMLLLEMLAPLPLLLHGMGALLILSRLLHFWGLQRSTGVSGPRTAAGVMTVGLIVAGSLALLFMAGRALILAG